jgi:prepilin-type N-terminal cleavage/methylation domain-containing protein
MMMRRYRLHTNQGFTLIELMVATMVFSVILLGATTAVIQISRMYYKGVISTRTQETSRRVIDDISRAAQFSDEDITIPGITVNYGSGATHATVRAFCIGNTRYSYVLNAQVDSAAANGVYNSGGNHRIRHALWRDSISNPQVCVSDPGQPGSDPAHYMPDLTQAEPTANGEELLGRYMRLVTLDLRTANSLQYISVGVLYGDDDLLTPDANAPTGCTSLISSAQWCALSELSTQVYQRINPDVQ